MRCKGTTFSSFPQCFVCFFSSVHGFGVSDIHTFCTAELGIGIAGQNHFPPEEKQKGCFLPLDCRLRVKYKKQDAYVIFSEKDFAISQKMC